MGLISETVEITWQTPTSTHYKNLGYQFTQYGDVFEVKVEHLPSGSNVFIEVKCDGDNCENPYLKPMKWHNYKKSVKEDGKYYCQKCAMKLYGGKNLSKVLFLKHGKSFEQWCIENNRQDILDRWDYELNDCDPSEIAFGTNKKYYFKCPKEIHKSELKNIINFISGQEGSMNCNQCNSFAQWGIDNICEDFLEKYWDYELNKNINPWKLNYGVRTKKIWLKCQLTDYHESYRVSPNSFTNMNSRCPYCTNKKVHPLDSLGKLLEDKGLLHLWSNKNKKSPYKYAPYSNEEVWWKCPNNKHEDYYRKISNSNIFTFNCPECIQERDESFLQEKVRLYLEQLDCKLFHEYKCTLKCINPKTNYLLPYDNEIIINNCHLIIEVHGMQHYSITNFHILSANKFNTIPQYELEYIQYKDKIKKDYVLYRGYSYLEIPYWTDDKKETWKKLIDDKIININIIGNITEEKEVS